MKFEMYHSCITVLDLEKSMAFYEEALGLTEVRRMEAEDGSWKIVFLASDSSPSTYRLELTWYRDRKDPYDLGDNEIHIGFRTADIDKAHEKHKEMGCICFENESLGVYFIEDPDGYWMEIVPVR
ncbi:MAG: lactoylglutathione lyase [Firmicutes bacterium]|jgi:lactoylglutathione lyase|nr:lactoylglutathione lyase [Bacillota bacterium]